MTKNTSTQIREFVKNALKSYYDNFQVKLSDIAKKDDVNPAIKINNDGSVYIYDLGNYDGSSIQNASSLQNIIKNMGGSSGNIAAGNNIQIDTAEAISTISALGYTYNKNTSSFAEGYDSEARGTWAHAEGRQTLVQGSCGHVEGYKSKSQNRASHAEGESTLASGNYSHAEGYHTAAANEAEHAEGKYNVSNTGKTIHSIGIGSSSQSKNALEVLNDGSIFITGLVTTNSYNGTSISNVSTLQAVINEKIDKNTASASFASKSHSHYYNINQQTVSSISIFAPINSGTMGQFLMSTGSVPTWVTVSINDTIPTGDFSLYTPTNSGTYGQFLMSTGSGTPVWTSSNAEPSDERLKNIKSELSVEDCYKLINDCSTIIYSLKTDEKDQNQIGMIAQQVKEFIPEVVQESNGYYFINYSRLSVVALNLIKNLSKRIIELEKGHNKLEELVKRIETLENK